MDNISYKKIESEDDLFHKEIVDIFFSKSKKQPSVKKILPLKKHSYAILLVSLVLLTSLSLFYYVINTRMLNNEMIVSTYDKSYTRLLYNGIFDRAFIKSFSFEGDAKEESLILRNSVKLINRKKLGWARATFELNNLQNFSGANVLISGKSESGKKYITLILADADGKAYEIPAIIFLPKWERKNIELKAKSDFDFKKVKSISMEYGAVATGNNNGTTIYIKEMGVRKGG